MRPGDGGGRADRGSAAGRRRRRRDGRAHPADDARLGGGGAAGRTRRRHRAGRRGRGGRRPDRARRPAAARAGPRHARRRRCHEVDGAPPAAGRHRARPATRWCRRRPPSWLPGQVRDATASALAGLVRGAGGEPVPLGIVGDDAAALERGAARRPDPVRRRGGLGRVVGRCPGRDRRRGGPAGGAGDPVPRARPATRASRPCWPTAAGCRWSGCPATRCRRWSCSGCSGVPLVRRVGGHHGHPAGAERARRSWTGRCRRRPAGSTSCRSRSSAGRTEPVASPLFGASALLSVLTSADGWRRRARGRPPGCPPARCRRHAVPMTGSPFVRDVPAAEATAAWARVRGGDRLPRPGRRRTGPRRRGAGPGHRRAGLGAPVVAGLRRRRDGRHRGARGRHRRRRARARRCCSPPAPSRSSTPATRCPPGATRW